MAKVNGVYRNNYDFSLCRFEDPTFNITVNLLTEEFTDAFGSGCSATTKTRDISSTTTIRIGLASDQLNILEIGVETPTFPLITINSDTSVCESGTGSGSASFNLCSGGVLTSGTITLNATFTFYAV
jgi:hypothetical protein